MLLHVSTSPAGKSNDGAQGVWRLIGQSKQSPHLPQPCGSRIVGDVELLISAT